MPPLEPTNRSRQSIGSTADSVESQQLIQSLKSKITDQEEQIQTLIKKRRDDLEKVKELERTRLEHDKVRSRSSSSIQHRLLSSYKTINAKLKNGSKSWTISYNITKMNWKTRKRNSQPIEMKWPIRKCALNRWRSISKWPKKRWTIATKFALIFTLVGLARNGHFGEHGIDREIGRSAIGTRCDQRWNSIERRWTCRQRCSTEDRRWTND